MHVHICLHRVIIRIVRRRHVRVRAPCSRRFSHIFWLATGQYLLFKLKFIQYQGSHILYVHKTGIEVISSTSLVQSVLRVSAICLVISKLSLFLNKKYQQSQSYVEFPFLSFIYARWTIRIAEYFLVVGAPLAAAKKITKPSPVTHRLDVSRSILFLTFLQYLIVFVRS